MVGGGAQDLGHGRNVTLSFHMVHTAKFVYGYQVNNLTAPNGSKVWIKLSHLVSLIVTLLEMLLLKLETGVFFKLGCVPTPALGCNLKFQSQNLMDFTDFVRSKTK